MLHSDWAEKHKYQKPDRLRLFGTGVIRQYPQGLLVLT